jgi:hypothetical protein
MCLVQTLPFLFFRQQDGSRYSIKHTLINCEATKEVVINVVNFDLVQKHFAAQSMPMV